MGLISLKKGQKVALDTNIFIYSAKQSDPLHYPASQILTQIESLALETSISVLVFEEYLVRIYKLGLEKELSYHENLLTGGGLIKVVDFTRDIAKIAAQIRARFSSIKTPDAIHLASALEAGAKIFITTDKRLDIKLDSLKIEVLKF